jgi:hypothetical protein
MYERWRDRVAFFVVYIKEAHPEDGWVLAANRREGIAARDPQSHEERSEIAQATSHAPVQTLSKVPPRESRSAR